MILKNDFIRDNLASVFQWNGANIENDLMFHLGVSIVEASMAKSWPGVWFVDFFQVLCDFILLTKSEGAWYRSVGQRLRQKIDFQQRKKIDPDFPNSPQPYDSEVGL